MLLFVSAHGAHNIEAQDGVLVENAGAWLAACQSLALCCVVHLLFQRTIVSLELSPCEIQRNSRVENVCRKGPSEHKKKRRVRHIAFQGLTAVELVEVMFGTAG